MMYIFTVSENWQVTVLLQQFNFIQTSIASLLSNINKTLNIENTLSIDYNNGKPEYSGILLDLKLNTS